MGWTWSQSGQRALDLKLLTMLAVLDCSLVGLGFCWALVRVADQYEMAAADGEP